jgi:hypothetical protein
MEIALLAWNSLDDLIRGGETAIVLALLLSQMVRARQPEKSGASLPLFWEGRNQLVGSQRKNANSFSDFAGQR